MSEHMIVLGVDPDVARPAVALVTRRQGHASVLAVDCIKSRAPKGVVGMARLPLTLASIREYLDHGKGRSFPTSIEVTHIVVEGQGIWRNNASPPQHILNLGIAAGMAMGSFSAQWPRAECRLPKPDEWKGGTTKHIHQARLCQKLGWDYEKKGSSDATKYCQPTTPKTEYSQDVGFNPGDWKHALDAVGLALFAFEQVEAAARRERRQAAADASDR
jgi:hypothetical protein